MADREDPDYDMDVDRDGGMEAIGGAGDLGPNRLGLPWAASAIGSGNVKVATRQEKIREGTSFSKNARRGLDRNDDTRRDYR